MIELGQTYDQTFTYRDGNGVLATPSPITCVITLPDSTTTTPTLNTLSTGVYQVVYTTTQVGQHTLLITGTVGPAVQPRTDVFNVASPAFLVSLADARLAIGLPTNNTTQDEALRTVMAGATPIMEDLIGAIVSTSHTGTYDGGNDTVALVHAPILSVTSVIESYTASYQVTLAATDLFSGSGSNSSFAYTVDLGSGVITRRASGVAINFAEGVRNIQVVYVAGRVLKGNQILAARRLIRHLWQTEQQGFRPTMGAPDTAMGTTPSGFAVPKAVIELCGPDTRPPGIG